MQTERVTYLTTPAQKALLARRAAAHGISMGEYLRRKAEGEDELTRRRRDSARGIGRGGQRGDSGKCWRPSIA